jgi:hypothetical protein
LEPIGFGLNKDDEWFFDPRDCEPDLVWPLKVGTVSDGGDAWVLNITMLETVLPKDVRGAVNRFGPFMVRSDHGQVYGNGKMLLTANVWVSPGNGWKIATSRPGLDREKETPVFKSPKVEIQDGLHVAMGSAIALRQRYEWAVSLGLTGSPTVRFATDPTGMKEIFRIRDLPEGKDRRAALMTWVQDHWRQNRKDPDLENYVRKNLRGAVSFTWEGMDVEVLPAQFDLDLRDRLIAERAAMKAAGTDVRTKAPRI